MTGSSTKKAILFSYILTIPLSISFLIPSPSKASFVNKNNAFQQKLKPSKSEPSCLFMGWGPDPIWTPAQVVECDKASSNSVLLTVKVPTETLESYTIPGQYIQLKENDEGKPLFLAIASPPAIVSEESTEDDSVFEFLIKLTDNNQWVTDSLPNLQISQVLGNGFPMIENFDSLKYDFPVQNVILCANGSGIAPIRAVIESEKALSLKSTGRTARLYYGCRHFDEMAFVSRFQKWEELGVEVVPILSQPKEGTEWQGRYGYIQTALEEDGIPIPRNSGALLCGVKGMAEAVTALFTKSGMFEGRILTNF